MIRWADWFSDLLVHLPGCPSFTVEHELRAAAIRFFDESRVWQARLDPIAVIASDPLVELGSDNPNEEDIVRVEAAIYDGRDLDVFSGAEMDARHSGDWMVATGAPCAIVQLTPGALQLYPNPLQNSFAGLQLRVSLRPADSASGIPDTLRTYRRAIVTGALAVLHAYADQPWSVPALAVNEGAEFQAAIDRANRAATRSFGRGRIASRPTWC